MCARSDATCGAESFPLRHLLSRNRQRDHAPRAGCALIANIRTDLDAFSEVEQAVLMNHGYALIDAPLRMHAPELIATDAAAFALPFPAFAPPAMGEGELRRRLAGSEKRKLTGRG